MEFSYGSAVVINCPTIRWRRKRRWDKCCAALGHISMERVCGTQDILKDTRMMCKWSIVTVEDANQQCLRMRGFVEANSSLLQLSHAMDMVLVDMVLMDNSKKEESENQKDKDKVPVGSEVKMFRVVQLFKKQTAELARNQDSPTLSEIVMFRDVAPDNALLKELAGVQHSHVEFKTVVLRDEQSHDNHMFIYACTFSNRSTRSILAQLELVQN